MKSPKANKKLYVLRFRWVKAYAVSKYLILLFTLELAEKTRDRSITVNAVNPGIVNTTIMMTNTWYDVIIKSILLPFFVDESEGAKTSVYLAESDEIKGITGKYFSKCKEVAIKKKYNDIKQRKALWNETEKLLKERGA